MNWLFKKQAGQFDNLGSGALSLGIGVITIGVIVLVLAQVFTTGLTVGGYGNANFNNTVTTGQSALNTMASFVPVLVIVFILALIVAFLGFGRKR